MKIFYANNQQEFDRCVAEADQNSEIYITGGNVAVNDYGKCQFVAIINPGTIADVYGCCQVIAYGDSTVRLHDASLAICSGRSKAEANDHSMVIGKGYVQIFARDHSTVNVRGMAVDVFAYDYSRVFASGSATVISHDQSSVFMTTEVRLQKVGDQTSWHTIGFPMYGHNESRGRDSLSDSSILTQEAKEEDAATPKNQF